MGAVWYVYFHCVVTNWDEHSHFFPLANVKAIFSLCVYPLQEQLSQVLDAMFERTVKVDEHVIDQGDDGDNFYVIER